MSERRAARLSTTDWRLLYIVLAMLVVGLVMVYSASYGFSLLEGGFYEGRPAFFVQRQAIFAGFGLIMLLVLWRIDYRLYRTYAVYVVSATMIILLVMAILGRWILQFPQAKSIQPAEIAKYGAIVYIAVWLAAKGEKIRDISLGLIPFALLLGTMAGLIVAQPDFSTAALLVATATAMFFVAGADMRQLLIAFVFGGAALVFVALLAPYRTERIITWLRDPLKNALCEGFQTVQSLAALNIGGWLGVGLGQSQQKFAIYAPHTDGMFAVIGEEVGFVGSMAVIVLYGLWVWRGLCIARRAPDSYGSLLAVGLTCWITFQAALHIAVVSALTPFTGTVLPFISYGGSSLVSSLAAVGVLLSISRVSSQPSKAA